MRGLGSVYDAEHRDAKRPPRVKDDLLSIVMIHRRAIQVARIVDYFLDPPAQAIVAGRLDRDVTVLLGCDFVETAGVRASALVGQNSLDAGPRHLVARGRIEVHSQRPGILVGELDRYRDRSPFK